MSHHFRKELLNNHLKITKWGVQSYLAGVETVKIGFVTRNNIKSNAAHTIVGFSDISLNDLLFNTNFNKYIAYVFF
jgi:translation initiation factor 3 subunit D